MTVEHRNLVLTGFMGCGKTTVAREVAQLLGRPLVVMDEVIAERAGLSVPEIFRQQGEAVFRSLERSLCAELADQQGLVIDTGGGALIDRRNREVLAQNGCLVCLDCAEEELLHRLEGKSDRPLLESAERAAKLHTLLEDRGPAYAQIPHHIDTTSRTPLEVTQEVIALLSSNPWVREVRTPAGSYQLQLVPGGLAHLGRLLRTRGIAGQVVIVSDENVWPLHGATVQRALEESGYLAQEAVLPAGEAHKRLETCQALYARFVEAELDRSGAVIALGGGVITDMAGFAASTYMRGVPLVQAPTTLLGMVDASIGGKVAVDLPQGKNLVGAFVQPLLVMLDPDTLSTLPQGERHAGMVEIIKAGVIGDIGLFEALERRDASERWAIERAVEVKRHVVEQDPYERDLRMVLNLGHTFAHAFELLSDYALPHGPAVSIGMVAASELALRRDLCETATVARIRAVLERHELPVRYREHPSEAVYAAMRHDKKRAGDSLRLVLPRAIGDCVVVSDVTSQEIIEALERIRS